MDHWFDSVKLAVFLREHRVLDILLGVPPSNGAVALPVHFQTLTRVPVILKYLAQVCFCLGALENVPQ